MLEFGPAEAAFSQLSDVSIPRIVSIEYSTPGNLEPTGERCKRLRAAVILGIDDGYTLPIQVVPHRMCERVHDEFVVKELAERSRQIHDRKALSRQSLLIER